MATDRIKNLVLTTDDRIIGMMSIREYQEIPDKNLITLIEDELNSIDDDILREIEYDFGSRVDKEGFEVVLTGDNGIVTIEFKAVPSLL